MMRKIAMLMTVALAALVFAAGCTPQASEPAAPSSSEDLSTREPQGSPEPTPDVVDEEPDEGIDMSDLEIGEVPPAIFATILADLSATSTLRVEDISVVKAESVVWPDGSLGCPEPDMMYTMATVNGYHVVLETSDGTVDYRASANGTVRRCENPPFAPAAPIDSGPPTE